MAALLVAAQVKTHHLAIIHILNKPAYAIGKIIFIHAAGARSAPFRENHDGMPTAQQINAFIKHFLHLLTGTASIDGDALGQVT